MELFGGLAGVQVVLLAAQLAGQVLVSENRPVPEEKSSRGWREPVVDVGEFVAPAPRLLRYLRIQAFAVFVDEKLDVRFVFRIP